MGCVQYFVAVILSTVYFNEAVPILDEVSAQQSVGVLVNTNVGTVRGVTSANGEYSMFLGIPYATVNASNPFGPSSPHPGFSDIFDANDDSRVCPHRDEIEPIVVGSLDCLNLNVYVPNTINSDNPLPVMVWIHGGGFIWGSDEKSVYSPDFLVRHDVILVTLNYRLNIYGFMCLDIPEVPGNQALRDQSLALTWVENNIQSFGGDIGKITLFGQSAGAMSVDLHYLYNNDNLFHKIIMQSGSAYAPALGIREPNLLAPFQLAERLNFVSNDIYEVLDFLATIDPRVVIETANALELFISPCRENKFDTVKTFIHDYPQNVPETKDLPIIVGCNSHEILYAFIDQPREYFDSIDIFFENNAEYVFNSNIDKEYVIENLRRFYLTSDDPTSDTYDQNIRWDLSYLNSDFWLNYQMHRDIRKYSASGISPIYMYIFSHVGRRNTWKNRLNSTEGGANHYDEIAYLFEMDLYTNSSITPEDQLIIDRMTTMWTNFAKYDNPTPEVTELLPIQWPRLTRSGLEYLHINQTLSEDRRPWHHRMAYLDLFYELFDQYLRGN